MRDTKNNGQYSKFAQNKEQQVMSTIWLKTNEFVRTENKSQALNAYKRFYIYSASRGGVKLNDTHTHTHTESYNSIYSAILTTYPTQ
jgi:hypothetical protein